MGAYYIMICGISNQQNKMNGHTNCMSPITTYTMFNYWSPGNNFDGQA